MGILIVRKSYKKYQTCLDSSKDTHTDAIYDMKIAIE